MRMHDGNRPVVDMVTALDEQMRRYRDTRRRARAARPMPRTLTEPEQIVQDARRWAPYGTVPADHVFGKYGISRDEFAFRVRRALGEVAIDERTATTLSDLYARGAWESHQASTRIP